MSVTMSNGISHLTSKEPEAYKLFIGQVPRTWEEKDIRPIFEEYGDIYDLSILKDKFTGQHKEKRKMKPEVFCVPNTSAITLEVNEKRTSPEARCAFLTYFSKDSALRAQAALHERKTLPGMQHPMQVKPADSETKAEDRKLFVGMISKKATEDDLRIMFSPFGKIEEATVLKNPDGSSKGCAFIKFATRLQAQNAIRQMHNSTTMEGCTSPIVVKIADTEKDKIQKKMQSMASNILGFGLSMQLNNTLGTTGNTVGFNPYHQTTENDVTILMKALHGCQKVGIPWELSRCNNTCQDQEFYECELLQQAVAAGTLPVNLAAGMMNPSGPGGVSPLAMPGTMGAIVAAAALANQQQQQQQAQTQVVQQQLQQQQQQPQSLAQQQQQPQGLTQQPASFNGSIAGGQQAALTQGLNTVANTQASVANSLGGLGTVQGLGTGMQQLQGMQGGLGGIAGFNQMSGLSGLNTAAAAALTGMGGTLSNMSSSFANTGSSTDALTQAYSGIQQYAAAFPSAYTSSLFQQQNVRQPQKEGPDGANLFIYHLPPEFSDADLMQTFLPFGNVISAKVFIDRNTNLSKCFGFVSYENPASAQNAIQAMNGFSIGTKRLKVQLKRPKDANRPY